MSNKKPMPMSRRPQPKDTENPILKVFLQRKWGKEIEKVLRKMVYMEQFHKFNLEKYVRIIAYLHKNFRLPNGKKFKVLNWHALVLSLYYCYDGLTVIEIAAIVGRGNAKTMLAEFIAGLELIAGEKGAEFIGMSVTVDKGIESIQKPLNGLVTNPGTSFSKLFKKGDISYTIDSMSINPLSRLRSKGATFRIVSAADSALNGGREKLAVVDEFGTFPNNPLPTIREGLEKNEGLLLTITSNNKVRGGAYDEELDTFRGYNDEMENFKQWGLIFELDDYTQIEDPNEWYKANPALDEAKGTVSTETITRELNAARHSTIKANNLFSKRFNFSVNAVTSFFTAEEIEIVTDLDFEKVFYDKWAVLGCDFSLSGDTWGNVLLTKIDETLYIYPIPIRPKNVADKYKHLSGTFYHDEDKNDTQAAVKLLFDKLQELRIGLVGIGYDPAYSANFLYLFEQNKIKARLMEKVKQNAFTVSQHIMSLQRLLKTRGLLYNSEIMKQHLRNARVKYKDTTQVRLVKVSDQSKIDLVDAAVNALAVYELNRDYVEKYFERNVKTW